MWHLGGWRCTEAIVLLLSELFSPIHWFSQNLDTSFTWRTVTKRSMKKERAETVKGLKAMPVRHLKAFLMVTAALGSRDIVPQARAWASESSFSSLSFYDSTASAPNTSLWPFMVTGSSSSGLLFSCVRACLRMGTCAHYSQPPPSDWELLMGMIPSHQATHTWFLPSERS